MISILEKLKINKDIKNKYFSNEDWCIVVPLSETYNKFFDDFWECMENF